MEAVRGVVGEHRTQPLTHGAGRHAAQCVVGLEILSDHGAAGVAAHQGGYLRAGDHAAGREFEGAADQLVAREDSRRDLGNVAVVHEGHRRVLGVGHPEHATVDCIPPAARQSLP